jgi:hypothetical protein
MGRYDILLQQEQQPRPPRRVAKPRPLRQSSLPANAARGHAPTEQEQRSVESVTSSLLMPDRPIDRSAARSIARTPVRRTLGRVAFEFYLDQVEALRRLSLEQKMRGEKGSMSEMVRAAIDRFLAEHAHNNCQFTAGSGLFRSFGDDKGRDSLVHHGEPSRFYDFSPYKGFPGCLPPSSPIPAACVWTI